MSRLLIFLGLVLPLAPFLGRGLRWIGALWGNLSFGGAVGIQWLTLAPALLFLNGWLCHYYGGAWFQICTAIASGVYGFILFLTSAAMVLE